MPQMSPMNWFFLAFFFMFMIFFFSVFVNFMLFSIFSSTNNLYQRSCSWSW